MEQFYDFIFYFSLGYLFAKYLVIRHINSKKEKSATSESRKYKEEKRKILFLKTEYIDNQLLIYDVDNNFMSQGTSLMSATENLQKNKKVTEAIIKHDNTHFLYIDGLLKKIK